jgi:Dullard-like phosphatase family protein
LLLKPRQSQNPEQLIKQVGYNPVNVRIKSEHESIVKRSKVDRLKVFTFFTPKNDSS